MNIILEAYHPLDGQMFVRRDGKLYYMAPPFSKQKLIPARDEMLANAIIRFDFQVAEIAFESWESCLSYLDQAVSETRVKMGQDLDDNGIDETLLELAPQEVLVNFLDRIELELIPSRQLEHAENLLLAMLCSGNPSLETAMRQRAVGLIRKIRRLMQNLVRITTEIAFDASLLPSLTGSGQEPAAQKIAEHIRERGSVFPFLN